jgi:hypothetical protein
MGGEIEGDRKPLLPRSQIAPVSTRSFVIVLSQSQPVSYHSCGGSRRNQFYIMHDAPPSHPTAAESSGVGSSGAESAASSASSRTQAGIAALLVAYAAAAAFGWPQHGRDLLVQAQSGHETVAQGEAHGPDAAVHGDVSTSPPPATVLPFAVLLAAIAILPLTPQLSHWWEHNSSKLLVAGCLALVTLGWNMIEAGSGKAFPPK